MGGNLSLIDSQQILVVGLEGSGKSLFVKKLIDFKKKEIENVDLNSTVGYNYIQVSYGMSTFDIWELGGDVISRAYWATFYQNLKFNIVVYVINIYDRDSHAVSLKELLTLVNQEELKAARFFILFNIKLDERLKLSYQEATLIKECKDVAEGLLADLRECSIHDYDTRVFWDIIDISKIKDGENKTKELLSKCLLGNQANIN